MVEREEAIDQIRINFAKLRDKEQAWADLLLLTQDKHSDVRQLGATSLGFLLSHGLVNKQALVDLIRLTEDEDSNIRRTIY
jgi:HEAT repeat protein